MLQINRCCNQFETAWQAGEQPDIEEAVSEVPAEYRVAALRELLPLEIEYRRAQGLPLSLQTYAQRFPQLERSWLAELLAQDAVSSQTPLPEKLGDYQITSRIGEGGMGAVYKAVHQRMGRTVALKILRPDLQQNEHLLQRFDREVRAAARLSHPHIVTALDAREEQGVHFLITEFVDGTDLDAAVRLNGPLSIREAIECILQAADGLEYAHAQGVVHRDIKPANLLRDSDGTVKILDMGLARIDMDDDPTAVDLTKSGVILGTAAYMAPEQARNTRRADARSDIYSLGCTLYFLLTGRPVFCAETSVDTILSHINEPVPALSESRLGIPPQLEQAFRRMVAKQADERFQTATEVIAALEDVLSSQDWSDEELAADALPNVHQAPTAVLQETVTGTPDIRINANTQGAPRTANQQKYLFATIAGALALVLLVGYLMFSDNESPSPPPMASPAVLEFNGTSSYVIVPDLVPTAGETYTLEAIARPQVLRTANVISWLGPDWMAVYLTEGQWGLGRRVGFESYLIATAEMPQPGETVHLAGVFRGTELQMFIDGQPATAGPTEFPLSETSGGLCIGGVPPDRLPVDQNDRFFSGVIYAVRISRGVRYTSAFKPPTELGADRETIAAFTFDKNTGRQVTGTGERAWQGEIVDATWADEAAE